MGSWLVVGLVLLGATDVEVTPLNGAKVVGTLDQVTAERIVVSTPAGPQTLDLKSLQSVRSTNAKADTTSAGDIRVELMDGSSLRCETFTAKSGKAALKLRGGNSVDIRTRDIRWVRFRAPQESVDSQWDAQIEEAARGDIIVIRKSARTAPEREPSVVLDRQSGIAQEVTAEVVQFELDGDRIPVKRERLEGLIYFHPTDREAADPVGRLEDIAGSVWNVRTLRSEGDSLAFESVSGVTGSMPLERVMRLDLSIGNTVFLSDLEPESVDWAPYIESRVAAANLAKFYLPRRDVGRGGAKLMLDGRSFDKGLSIHSKTTLVYRVPKNFRRLFATVGIDDHTRDLGHVQMTVLGDGKSLWSELVSGADKARELEVDITGVRRLTILVDYGQDTDRADVAVLGNARLTK